MERAIGSHMKGRKRHGWQGTGLTMKTFLYIEQHPSTSTLRHILMGKGTGSSSHYCCRHKHQSLCDNCNLFEQTACGCHHKVLANHPFNLHTSHARHEGVPSFNPGEGKMRSTWDMADPPAKNSPRFFECSYKLQVPFL